MQVKVVMKLILWPFMVHDKFSLWMKRDWTVTLMWNAWLEITVPPAPGMEQNLGRTHCPLMSANNPLTGSKWIKVIRLRRISWPKEPTSVALGEANDNSKWHHSSFGLLAGCQISWQVRDLRRLIKEVTLQISWWTDFSLMHWNRIGELESK